MHEDLIKRLREEASSWCINCCYRAGDCICAAPDDRKKDCDICSKLQAAEAIEERDRHILTLQHEMMAEAESHIALVEQLNKQIEELQADVRPVVRGKWEDVNVRDYSTNINGGLPLNIASMCCSVCKRWHNEVYHYGNPTEMAHFCPNCGADMREES